MARKTMEPTIESPVFKRKGARPRPFLALLCLITTVLATLALIDYSPNQHPQFQSPTTETNIIGTIGVLFGFHTLKWIGLAAWCLPLATLWMTYLFFRKFAYVLNVSKLIALMLLIVAFSVFSQILQIEALAGSTIASDPNYFTYYQNMGGWLGSTIYQDNFRAWLGTVGTMVLFAILAVFSIAFILGDNLLSDLSKRIRLAREEWKIAAAERRAANEEKRRIKAANRKAEEARAAAEAKKAKSKADAENMKKAPVAVPSKNTSVPPFPEEKRGLRIFGSKKRAAGVVAEAEESQKAASGESAAGGIAPFEPLIESDAGDTDTVPNRGTNKRAKIPPASAPTTTGAGLKIYASEQIRKSAVSLPEKKGDYIFPPMKLLVEPPLVAEQDSSDAHQETAELLVQTLEEFGIKVTMGDVHAGPVITRYDVYPAPGVRVERIANLDKNLALGLKALSVRILAPVPGKGCVGIEVPNKHPQSVFIRDILESQDWATNKAEIPIALGKEVSGRPLIADLTKMPHLLIAGSTGSGKTVCINAIITSLLYHSSPEDLRFVMVDPKIVEMQVFNSLPHMLIPVVTDPKKVPNALKYLLNEMEKRYQMFAEVGVRNIAGYNAKMATDRKSQAEAEARSMELEAALTPEERAAAANAVAVPRDPDIDGELPEKIPYVVCVVDELADLMMVAPADIETGIARLAQLARAAGIHLILATQRPSVNVITGIIKANLPSRIAFKVASKVDSRTILDIGGADQLIGRGDMLFLPPGSADLVRSQGAFVGDDEISGIVDFIAERNGKPSFDEQFQRSVELGMEDEGPTGDGDWDDDLVPDAIEVLRSSKRASTSMLQRRLKIGYNRAARIMEILEAEGIVGPENGSSPREILKDLDSL